MTSVRFIVFGPEQRALFEGDTATPPQVGDLIAHAERTYRVGSRVWHVRQTDTGDELRHLTLYVVDGP